MYKKIEWNVDKAKFLLESRGIDLSKVESLIREDRFRMEMVPNQLDHGGQRMFIVSLDGYACCVPFVESEDGNIFVKTAFWSRIAQKKYRGLLK